MTASNQPSTSPLPTTATPPAQTTATPPASPQPGYPDDDSRYAEIDGIQVHHKLLPAAIPHAPVAVCLHGFGASLFSFEACPALRNILTLVPYDTPGFGFTSRPTRLAQYTRRVSAAIATSLANAYAPTGRYVLLAHSMGASTAARVILPDAARLAAVVLIAPALLLTDGGSATSESRAEAGSTQRIGGGSSGPASMFQRMGSFIRERIAAASVVLLGLLTPLLVLLLRTFVSKRSFWENGIRFSWPEDMPPPPSVVDGYRRPIHAPLWEKGVLRFTRAALHESAVPPEESGLVRRLAMLDTLAPPILIVHGDCDKIIPLEHSRKLAEQLPTATLLEIPGAGHTPHEERPEQFTQLVEGYLRGLGLLTMTPEQQPSSLP